MARPGLDKPYIRLAATLVVFGIAAFSIERWLFGQFRRDNVHLDPNLLSALFALPLILVAAGIVVWIVGRMRRL